MSDLGSGGLSRYITEKRGPKNDDIAVWRTGVLKSRTVTTPLPLQVAPHPGISARSRFGTQRFRQQVCAITFAGRLRLRYAHFFRAPSRQLVPGFRSCMGS
jgi:hypothetical protein